MYRQNNLIRAARDMRVATNDETIVGVCNSILDKPENPLDAAMCYLNRRKADPKLVMQALKAVEQLAMDYEAENENSVNFPKSIGNLIVFMAIFLWLVWIFA